MRKLTLLPSNAAHCTLSVLVCLFVLTTLIVGTVRQSQFTKPAGSLIIANAKVWTATSRTLRLKPSPFSAPHPRGRFEHGCGNLARPNTQVIDAEGKLLLPGFNDTRTCTS